MPTKIAPALRAKLKKIQFLVLDVDGVLSDSRIFWQKGSGWTRSYSTRDGVGIIEARKWGIETAIISGGQSEDLKERIKYLGIEHSFLGIRDKLAAIHTLFETTPFKPDQTLYMGDDYPDIPPMREVLVSATVPDAVLGVAKEADIVTKVRGGDGAVREVIEMIRIAKGIPIEFS